MTKCCHQTIFGIGELKLMLSDWLKVLRAHVQSRFHILDDLQKECGLLAIQFFLPQVDDDVSSFSLLSSPWIN